MIPAKNIFERASGALDTAVLVLNNSNTLSFAAATDPMRAANRRAGKPLFHWRFCTALGAPAELTTGLQCSGDPIAQLERCDLLIIVAGFDLENQATPHLSATLRRLSAQGTNMIAIDGGPWILAQSGLLDGYRATTHWEDLEAFATRFPEVDTQRDRYCISSPFATSGGAAPAIDLMLHLIALRWGPDLARRTASAFLYDPVPEGRWQSPSSLPRDPRLPRAIKQAVGLMSDHIEDPISIGAIAGHVGLTTRRLAQIFAQEVGQTAQGYYLQLRLSEAHRLALDTALPVKEIAAATGFKSQSSFARAFQAQFSTSVRALRGPR